MPVKAGWYTPMLHVRDIGAALRFYALLGFELVDQIADGGVIGWARMHCEGGAVMFLQAEGDAQQVDHVHHGVMFVLYTPDLPALREHLVASGVPAPDIHYPEYSPSGSLDLHDPDGYPVSIVHWSDQEHEVWERERRQRIAGEPGEGGA